MLSLLEMLGACVLLNLVLCLDLVLPTKLADIVVYISLRFVVLLLVFMEGRTLIFYW